MFAHGWIWLLVLDFWYIFSSIWKQTTLSIKRNFNCHFFSTTFTKIHCINFNYLFLTDTIHIHVLLLITDLKTKDCSSQKGEKSAVRSQKAFCRETYCILQVFIYWHIHVCVAPCVDKPRSFVNYTSCNLIGLCRFCLFSVWIVCNFKCDCETHLNFTNKAVFFPLLWEIPHTCNRKLTCTISITASYT